MKRINGYSLLELLIVIGVGVVVVSVAMPTINEFVESMKLVDKIDVSKFKDLISNSKF